MLPDRHHRWIVSILAITIGYDRGACSTSSVTSSRSPTTHYRGVAARPPVPAGADRVRRPRTTRPLAARRRPLTAAGAAPAPRPRRARRRRDGRRAVAEVAGLPPSGRAARPRPPRPPPARPVPLPLPERPVRVRESFTDQPRRCSTTASSTRDHQRPTTGSRRVPSTAGTTSHRMAPASRHRRAVDHVTTGSPIRRCRPRARRADRVMELGSIAAVRAASAPASPALVSRVR
jgi:hypothetical protein